MSNIKDDINIEIKIRLNINGKEVSLSKVDIGKLLDVLLELFPEDKEIGCYPSDPNRTKIVYYKDNRKLVDNVIRSNYGCINY